MDLNLARALRLAPYQRKGYSTTNSDALPLPPGWTAGFVGAGGKTTALFQLARQLQPPVTVSTTTHLGSWQVALADRHIIVDLAADLDGFEPSGVTLITGAAATDDRLEALGIGALLRLHQLAMAGSCPLLIEADGSRQLPLKAPGAHEPVIPDFVDMVITVAGLSGLGKPLSDEYVHRPDGFAELSGLKPGDIITAQAVARVLTDARGGLKDVPFKARRIALLNQAGTETTQAQARGMMNSLLKHYDAAIVADLASGAVHAVHERVAGIVLAAGGSSRFGQTKQSLDWHGEPFVRAVARKALEAGLSPVLVVTGADAERVEACVRGLSVTTVRNESWQGGQASSLRAGVNQLPDEIGAAVFLLADQPQVTHDVIQALVEAHATGLRPIVAPLVMMEQRANPVLFDRITFSDLLALEGDVGGRAIFFKYPVEYMPWHDDRLLLDVDTEKDYRRLTEDDTL